MSQDIKPTHYLLQSVKTGQQFSDQGWTLDAPNEKEPSLIRTVYEEVQLEVKDASLGLFRFDDWLPVTRFLEGSSAPITYKSEGLAKHLGLENLYITFSGYWPEKGVNMRTCSFKETEAFAVGGRITPATKGVLVVASAGNTARAFARVCSDNNIPLLLCVPEDNLDAMWFDEPINDSVKLVCTRTGSDYFDAIHLSNKVVTLPGYYAEGGARNVARRYGNKQMKLMIAQNEPFLAVYNAWKADSRQLMPLDDDEARKQSEAIVAKVLANRFPPYPIPGGLYDCLKDSGGDVLKATNEEAMAAAELFEQLEGNDILPAPAVATAALIAEAKAGRIPKDATVMLNITGGGEKHFKRNKEIIYKQPDHIFDINPGVEDIKKVLDQLFK